MKIFFAILCSLLLAGGPVWATLTARVTPGYQFSDSERPTTSTLNALATPTITIYGTVDGSTGLTPDSVTGDMLSSSVADSGNAGTYNTLDWISVTGGRALEVAAGGISWRQLNTNAFGRGLSGGWSIAGGSGTNLNVNYDGTTITLDTNNALKIADSFQAGIFYSYPKTPGYTNAWGYTNAFAITNFAMTIPTNSWTYTTNVAAGVTNIATNSTAYTLTNTDVVPLFSKKQQTNTSVTLEAVAQFVTNSIQNLSIQNLNSSNVTVTNIDFVTITSGGGVFYKTGTASANTANITVTNIGNWPTTNYTVMVTVISPLGNLQTFRTVSKSTNSFTARFDNTTATVFDWVLIKNNP